jgi:DNA-binding response OmpR family regulator
MNPNERIFVLDDKKSDADFIAREFSRWFGVQKFTQGKDLIDAIERDQSDEHRAAIIDLQLTGQSLDGEGICREIKKLKPYLPVIAVTGSTDANFVAASIRGAVFDDLIAKADVGPRTENCIAVVMRAIKHLNNYPQLPRVWQEMKDLKLENFELVVKAEFRRDVEYGLKKAYFYVLISESIPILDALMLQKNTPCGESLIQSAAVVEAILNYEDRLWREEIRRRGTIDPSLVLPSERAVKLDRVLAKGLLPGSLKSNVEILFEGRDRSAHPSGLRTPISKEAALAGLSTAIGIVKHYLSSKRHSVFPNS